MYDTLREKHHCAMKHHINIFVNITTGDIKV